MSRVDNWTGREDKLLIDTVLDFVRNGKTQLKAFEEVGDKIDRSPEACGFRWNKFIRREFEGQLAEAKKEWRKKKKGSSGKEVITPVVVKPREVKTVSVYDLEVKEFKGQRVVTFKDIDEVHDRPEGTAKRTFHQNKKHLIHGEDYFFLAKEGLEGVRKTYGLDNRVNEIYLFSETGYLMLVKSFTDDLAWEVQRKLVKNYFRVKEVVNQQVHSYMIMDPVERAKAWIKEQEEKQKIETEKLMLEQTVAEYQPKVSYLDTILESKDSVIVSQISEDYGLSAMALNKILHEENIQYKRNEQWLLYSEYKGLGYTESRTIPFIKPNGDRGTSLQTRWTQKGRLFIHNVLSNRGIKPLMDR